MKCKETIDTNTYGKSPTPCGVGGLKFYIVDYKDDATGPTPCGVGGLKLCANPKDTAKTDSPTPCGVGGLKSIGY